MWKATALAVVLWKGTARVAQAKFEVRTAAVRRGLSQDLKKRRLGGMPILWQKARKDGTFSTVAASICAVHGTNFLAVPFMTIPKGVPSASFADVKMNSISRMLLTHTKSTVAVISKFPD